jgi:hypothetical protein
MKSTPRSANGNDLFDRIPLWILFSIGVAILLVLGVGVFTLGAKGQTVQEDKTATEGELQTEKSKVETGVQLAGANLEACKDPTVIQALRSGGYDQLCELAVIVQTQGKQGNPGDRGPGPTQDQIDTAVQAYFATHPLPEGKGPTIAQVTTVVGEYLRANPPEPGRPPTPEEIALATANYIADHINDFQGPRGETGPPPSAEDIRVAVSDYCAQENRCRGAQGPQGIGVTGTILKRDDQGVCTLYFNLENPANGNVTQSSVQVNDEMCSPPPTTTTTTPEPLLPTGGG